MDVDSLVLVDSIGSSSSNKCSPSNSASDNARDMDDALCAAGAVIMESTFVITVSGRRRTGENADAKFNNDNEDVGRFDFDVVRLPTLLFVLHAVL